MKITPLTPSHWPDVERIYQEGIESNQATFETTTPSWYDWDKNHLDECRFVTIDNGIVVAWAALLPVSTRAVYSGVAEESIYITKSHWGKGIGYMLLSHLISISERKGIYSLQAVLFPENLASVRLHEKCGFRKIGFKRKIAQRNGIWRDTVLYEKRSEII